MFQNLGGSALRQSNFFGGEKATPTEPLDFAAFRRKLEKPRKFFLLPTNPDYNQEKN